MNFRLTDVEVRYGASARPALEGVSCDIPGGAFFAVAGPNGSGKTTLMRALLGRVPLAAGAVEIEGRPLERWRRRELARQVGAVAQSEPMPFPVSVRETVAMGRYPHLGPVRAEGPADRAAIRSALEECHVEGLSQRDVGTLSGGELQRVRIARALAQTPRALVLDEPTASLDIRHEMEIFHLLRRWAGRGFTVVVVSHKLELVARFADRILLLDEGRKIVEGPPAETLTEAVLERVYRWPLRVRRDPETGDIRIIPEDRGPGSAS